MSKRMTEMLEQLKSGGTVDPALVSAFQNQLCRIAERRLSKAILRRVGPSDVAMMAIKSAVSDLQHGRAVADRTDAYFQLLCTYLRKKVLEVARTHSAEKRDARAEVEQDVPPEGTVAIEDDPIVKAISNELDEFIEQTFPERDAAIVRAAIFLEMTAADIFQRWDVIVPGFPRVSQRMVSEIVRLGKERVAKLFQ